MLAVWWLGYFAEMRSYNSFEDFIDIAITHVKDVKPHYQVLKSIRILASGYRKKVPCRVRFTCATMGNPFQDVVLWFSGRKIHSWFYRWWRIGEHSNFINPFRSARPLKRADGDIFPNKESLGNIWWRNINPKPPKTHSFQYFKNSSFICKLVTQVALMQKKYLEEIYSWID